MQKCLKFFLHSKKLSKANFFFNKTYGHFLFKTNLKLFCLKNEETLKLDEKSSADDTKNVSAEAQERITINRI